MHENSLKTQYSVGVVYFNINNLKHLLTYLMPSPSAFSKFVLSVLKYLGILKFLSYTQNILGVLK